jgi:RNA polymerase sigma-70 factor (ECF subfamily)
MAKGRAVVYCIVPRQLAGELLDPLRQFFGTRPDVEVIVEQRTSERRSGERRHSTPKARQQERRQIRAAGGRRIAERRAEPMPAAPLPLPPAAQPHRDALSFIERVEPSTLEEEDVDTARLVMRIQAGENELFGRLYQRYFDRVYAYLYIALQDTHEVEDASQEVFMRVFEALPRYERRAVPFRAWLFRIVRNTGINQLRKRHQLTVEAPDKVARRVEAGGEVPEPTSLEWLEDRQLVALIERLPLAQRQVIVLRYMLELSSEEIGQVLGRKPDAIRQLHQRAMRFLRDNLSVN